MRLKDIKDIYHKELDDLYGKNEVDSFFNLAIEHYLQLDRIHLFIEPEFSVTKTEEQPLFETLSALKQEQPIQYILGQTEFYGLPFEVTPDTLIPRPETEELVDLIIKDSAVNNQDKPLKILDIGTGSGCIAISLAKHLTNAKVTALDISEAALKVAKRNAELNQVAVEFVQGDILNSAFDLGMHTYDIIVSNPPYVRHLEQREMKPNVLENEPHLALFVENDDPLKFYKAIVTFTKAHLHNNGALYFEINEYLGEDMIQLLKHNDFNDITLKTDLFGKDRMLKGIL